MHSALLARSKVINVYCYVAKKVAQRSLLTSSLSKENVGEAEWSPFERLVEKQKQNRKEQEVAPGSYQLCNPDQAAYLSALIAL